MAEVVRPGDRGEQVLDIQARLGGLGYAMPADERAGVFGPATEQAVRAFQQDRGLIVDGLVGPDTWRELVEASWTLGDRILYLRAPHMRGDDVRDLQDRLASLGFDPGRSDGIFGPQTARALEEFQRNYGITPDAIVAEATLRGLGGLPSIAGGMSVGRVRQLEALRARPGSITGMRIVIDPGHGGDDPGFVGPGGIKESDVCFALAARLDAALAAGGAQTFVTRRAPDGPEDAARASLANALEADLFVALHLGGGEPGSGAAAYYFGHKSFRSEAGALLAESILTEVCRLGLVNGRAHPKTFPVLRETRMPAVVLEAGYVTDPDEEELLADPSFIEQLAAAIAAGIVRFARDPVPA